MTKKPKGAIGVYMGSWVKIGLRGKVFRWDGYQWILSSSTVQDLKWKLDPGFG